MLIVCPNCAARYEVAALALPAQGREAECTACGHVWLHLPPPDARRAAAAAGRRPAAS
ncbi:MAG: zinc-ribbon domain-containing protein [Gemmobacter sp.]